MFSNVQTRSITRHITTHGKCGGRCLPDNENLNFGYGPVRVNKACPQRCNVLKCPLFAHHLPLWVGDDCLPEFMLAAYGGRCPNCLLVFGRTAVSSLVDNCPVCLEPKLMSRLRCGHDVCWTCWKTICLLNVNMNALCPLCRAPNY